MIDTTPAARCAAQPAAPTPDYYYTYHAAQQEEARPNLCPECNGTGGKPTMPNFVDYIKWIDCPVCLGEGTLSRPYDEVQAWADQLRIDIYEYQKRWWIADA